MFSPLFTVGKEYSYGGGGGIVVSRPRSVEGAEYRETIFMGTTYLSDKQIRDVIHDFKKTFSGDFYQMIQQYDHALRFTVASVTIFPMTFVRYLSERRSLPTSIAVQLSQTGFLAWLRM